MRLVEQGHLDLDESIAPHRPQFPQKQWPITTRQLLTHTSGVRDYADYESELSHARTAAERAEVERRQTRDMLSTFGVMSFPNEHDLWIGHTGRQAGASSIVVLIPDQDLSIAILTNVKGWGGYLSLVREIYSIVERDITAAN
jgi:CubicO group peptidase (beta-lactamase class C family)